MIHCFPVVADNPELHLQEGDMLLVELDAHDPIVRYQALPLNFIGLLPALIAQGIVSTTLSDDDLASLASGHEPPGADACLAPRGELDRRQEERRVVRLRLVASE